MKVESKRRRDEAKFQTQFGKWVMRMHDGYTGSKCWELKITQTNSLPFSEVKPHQNRALWLASTPGKKLYYKMADEGFSQKPFDCFMINVADAYVVIKYMLYPMEFVMIQADVFAKEDKTSRRRSLTRERALELGIEYAIK